MNESTEPISSGKGVKTGIVVSHTHWDRAWYLTFQQFRHRMVRMIDRLVDLLNTNPDFHSFTLDGQTILLDDYLEIRPYNETVLKNLISSGKMIVGPWYILPDLFLVSGESVIRNLQIGLATARKYGSPMQEGYVPDPFGHFAQLPQILAQFGINSFIFMRGLDEDGKSKAGTLFDWKSPDGSKVLTTYLVDGYFNGAALGYPEQFGRFDGLQPDPELAYKRAHEAVEKLSKLQKESVFLINNGFDHMPEQPELPSLLRHLNSNGSGTQFRHGTFRDFFDGVRQQGIDHEVLEGDLLGNVDHPILSSVFSTRIYLKQQNHLAQSLLEKYTEPLLLWGKFNTDSPDTHDFLQYAWKLLMQNHPHDDICGCSADGVHDDDEVRFRQVTELSESMMVEQAEYMLRSGIERPKHTSDHATDVLLYNPHPWELKTTIETSVLFPHPEGEFDTPRSEKVLRAVDADGNELKIDTLSSVPHTLRNNFLETSWGRQYKIRLTATIPASGYHIVHVFESDEEAKLNKQSAPVDTFTANGTELRAQNDSYSVYFSESGIRLKNFVEFEYQSDNGDTYSFGPVPENGVTWADFIGVTTNPDQSNSVLLRHELSVPAGLNMDESTKLDISTRVTLQDDGSLAFDISYINTARDGRLRLVLPASKNTENIHADGHFRLAKRARVNYRTPESAPDRYKAYPGELDYPTQHMLDFVLMSSEEQLAWVAGRGIHEFEIINKEGDNKIALTVNRSVGLLSTGNGRIRRCQAGPAIQVPGAQCLRPIRVNIAMGSEVREATGTAIRKARSFAHPAWVREMPYLPHLKPEGRLPRTSSILNFSNDNVALSSFRLHPDGITAVLRLYNLSDENQPVDIKTSLPLNQWTLSDLNERWSDEQVHTLDAGQFSTNIGPHQIQTILLRKG